MKRFVFSLASVLQLRRQQFEIERGKLSSLQAQIGHLNAERATLDAQLAATRQQVRSSPYLHSEQLAALNEFELWSKRKSEGLHAQRLGLDQQLARQRGVVVAAKRNVRVLEKFEKNQRAIWEAECSREFESMAGDFFNARLLAARRSRVTRQYRMSDAPKVSPQW